MLSYYMASLLGDILWMNAVRLSVRPVQPITTEWRLLETTNCHTYNSHLSFWTERQKTLGHLCPLNVLVWHFW